MFVSRNLAAVTVPVQQCAMISKEQRRATNRGNLYLGGTAPRVGQATGRSLDPLGLRAPAVPLQVTSPEAALLQRHIQTDVLFDHLSRTGILVLLRQQAHHLLLDGLSGRVDELSVTHHQARGLATAFTHTHAARQECIRRVGGVAARVVEHPETVFAWVRHSKNPQRFLELDAQVLASKPELPPRLHHHGRTALPDIGHLADLCVGLQPHALASAAKHHPSPPQPIWQTRYRPCRCDGARPRGWSQRFRSVTPPGPRSTCARSQLVR